MFASLSEGSADRALGCSSSALYAALTNSLWRTLTTRAGQEAPLRSLEPRTSTLTKDTLERVLNNVRCGSVVVFLSVTDSVRTMITRTPPNVGRASVIWRVDRGYADLGINMNDSLSVETVAQSVRSNAVTRGQDIRVLSQN